MDSKLNNGADGGAGWPFKEDFPTSIACWPHGLGFSFFPLWERFCLSLWAVWLSMLLAFWNQKCSGWACRWQRTSRNIIKANDEEATRLNSFLGRRQEDYSWSEPSFRGMILNTPKPLFHIKRRPLLGLEGHFKATEPTTCFSLLPGAIRSFFCFSVFLA